MTRKGGSAHQQRMHAKDGACSFGIRGTGVQRRFRGFFKPSRPRECKKTVWGVSSRSPELLISITRYPGNSGTAPRGISRLAGRHPAPVGAVWPPSRSRSPLVVCFRTGFQTPQICHMLFVDIRSEAKHSFTK